MTGTPPEPTLLGDRLAHWAETVPSTEAMTYGDRTWTWAEWRDRVHQATGGLLDNGVRRGDRIAFLDLNNVACLEMTFAAAAIGAANAILNWRLAADELDYVINDSGARVLFVGAELLPTLDPIRDRLSTVERIVVVGGESDEYEPWLANSEPRGTQPDVRPDDPCLVMYSSGTTGRPKGVLLTHHNVVSHAQHASLDWDFDPGDKSLVAMPLFHVGGTCYAVIGIHVGTPTIMTREPDAAALFGALQQGATHAFLVPAVVAGIVAAGDQAVAAFAQLKHLGYGASPMPLPLLRTALKQMPDTRFQQVYGLTELAGVISSLDPEDHRDEDHPERLSSAGTLIEGAEMRVVDPATGEDVEPGMPGEFWFRSSQATPGYLNKPEATAEALTPAGWFRSGDVGRVDPDGYLFVEDRVKDMIITGGENVYSPEVERVLVEHPSIAEAAVIGVPDDRWGESVLAVVTAGSGESPDPDEIIEFTRARLAHYKCPSAVEVHDELPRNPTGKILKRTLRAPHWEGRERTV